MPEVSEERKEIIKLERDKVTLLTAITTGHGLFAQHLAKWTNINNTCKRAWVSSVEAHPGILSVGPRFDPSRFLSKK